MLFGLALWELVLFGFTAVILLFTFAVALWILVLGGPSPEPSPPEKRGTGLVLFEPVSRKMDHWGTNVAVLPLFGFVFGMALLIVGDVPLTGDAVEGNAYFLVGLMWGLFLVGSAFVDLRRRQIIRNTPTATIRSLAVGPVEIHGTAEPIDEPATAPVSGADCVLYEYTVEKFADDRDEKTVESGRSHDSFSVEDDTGRVQVDPWKARLSLSADNCIVVEEGETPPEPVQSHFGQGPPEADMRYTERYIAPGEDIYVFGTAVPDDSGATANPDRLTIQYTDDAPLFLISNSDESTIVTGLLRDAVLQFVAGFALTAALLTFLFTAAGFL